MIYLPSRCLLGLAFLSLPIIGKELSTPPSPSPQADTELICPNANPAECYPRLFQPTKEFQLIKEGQDLPPGLHVRMNIYSGKKEARLNIPLEGEEDPGLKVPIEQAVVVVPQSEEEAPVEQVPQIPQKAPVYEAAGKIQPPRDLHGSDDLGTFQRAMITIAMEGRDFDTALDELSELSHDIYYGVEIVKDGPVLEKLICLTLGSGTEKVPAKELNRDHKAATVLGTAIQNNPTALMEISKSWNLVMYPKCPGEAQIDRHGAVPGFVSIFRERIGRDKNPDAMRAKINFISGLLKDPLIRSDFMSNAGMEVLLAVWLKQGSDWDLVRMKIAQLLMDNFLDESMGAELGIWPLAHQVAEKEICENKRSMLQDGCWEYHIQTFLDQDLQGRQDVMWGWAEETLTEMKIQRELLRGKKIAEARVHEEL